MHTPIARLLLLLITALGLVAGCGPTLEEYEGSLRSCEDSPSIDWDVWVLLERAPSGTIEWGAMGYASPEMRDSYITAEIEKAKEVEGELTFEVAYTAGGTTLDMEVTVTRDRTDYEGEVTLQAGSNQDDCEIDFALKSE